MFSANWGILIMQHHHRNHAVRLATTRQKKTQDKKMSWRFARLVFILRVTRNAVYSRRLSALYSISTLYQTSNHSLPKTLPKQSVYYKNIINYFQFAFRIQRAARLHVFTNFEIRSSGKLFLYYKYKLVTRVVCRVVTTKGVWLFQYIFCVDFVFKNMFFSCLS